MKISKLTDAEFELFAKIVHKEIGIFLTESKKTLVENRLTSRMLKHELSSYSQYLRIIQINQEEKIHMLNLITTNETYFFREEDHFEFLKDLLIKRGISSTKFRVLSAASSIGAEAYSISMVLDNYTNHWDVVGTDINSDVVKKARMGLYPLSFAKRIPDKYLKKYCLKGSGRHENQFIIDKSNLNNVEFFEANLINYPNSFGVFDVIFLRNVLMYFDDHTRQRVIDNLVKNLKKGGYFIISLTENLSSINTPYFTKLGKSIYQKI
jgi:chemotaxis protein methyltransferase CheR